MFVTKFAFSLVAFTPRLYAPWFAKVLLDQVIQQQSIEDQLVTFPFYFEPFVEIIEDMAPMEVILFLSVIFILLLMVFGRGGLYPNLEFRQDSATQCFE